MSSSEYEMEPDSGHQRGNKKRRIARACDVCRRRKSRCDGSQMDGGRCSTCLDANLECTYLEAAVKRTPARSTYIESLEARLERSESQVKHLRSELTAAHFASTVAASSSSNRNALLSQTDNGDPTIDSTKAWLFVLRTAIHSLTVPQPPPLKEDLEHMEIRKKMEELKMDSKTPGLKFMGKSSGVSLVKTAIDLKVNAQSRERRRAASASASASASSGSPAARTESGDSPGTMQSLSEVEEPEPTNNDDSDEWDKSSAHSSAGLTWTARRLQYWTFKPWENASTRSQSYTFPPMALMNELVTLYFTHINTYLPLLHRPTFERGIREGLFLRHDGFAATVLLVCANASRWHPDPRVGAPGGIGVGLDDRYGRGPVSYADTNGNHSVLPPKTVPSVIGSAPGMGLACGWAWFDQVPLVGSHMFGQATLYDLQYYALAVQFLEGSSAPQSCWTILGVGLRLALDLGVHRRSSEVEPPPTVERELMKRAFWVLLYEDRLVSSGMGRPCSLQFDDFDVNLPIECDDQYWEDPLRPFEQPVGIPSKITFFNCLMTLNHLLAFSLKMLYSLGKMRVIFPITDIWEENMVAELDSGLNGWKDRIPEHLRWDPNNKNDVFFDQSAALQCGYYHLQILVHRPFIPMLRKKAPTSLPSLAICTNAARACATVVDVQRRRKGDIPVIFNFYAVFTSGIVLLLNVWSGKRTGLVANPEREIANVQKCMDVVKVCEDRWQHAGLLYDILSELANVGHINKDSTTTTVPPSMPPINPHGVSKPPEPRSHRNLKRYPSCHVETVPPSEHVQQATASLRQTFERPISDPEWRAPYQAQSHIAQSQAQTPTHSVMRSPTQIDPRVFGTVPMEPSAFAPVPGSESSSSPMLVKPGTWDPPLNQDLFAGLHTMDPTINGNGQWNGMGDAEMMNMEMNLIDQETINMWASAPIGIEVDDWGNYFSNFSELTQMHSQQYQPQPTPVDYPPTM
ncbi:Zn(2)-C6 fungal-type domain-containing protein [Mycena indigotica]|uniref:Zn(2)-C6 fungal-type domain-containing protein n=1 Tax=Mycena indigotica TaxID=2126181 RepID=A0A8H6W9I6_9AGAR|nr:Zn(2)-C6 fungal-type domain-containing protein [Mycena indigotica]KAF7309737.1 Zn(2)-C6 fungal-type domain-containing protein [Mycena indigotica]